jgi:hypothetical protein
VVGLEPPPPIDIPPKPLCALLKNAHLYLLHKKCEFFYNFKCTFK